MFMISRRYLIVAFCALVSPLFSQEPEETISEPVQTVETEKAGDIFELDYGVDAYYASLGLIVNFTRSEIPDYSDRTELDVYSDLLGQSLVPRFMLLEASVNPMPVLGTAVRYYAPDFYRSANISDSLNLIKAVTFGFEEPYAVSLFLGNIARFKEPVEETSLVQNLAHNTGYAGILVSAGNYHIKDNELIDDYWYELEWKIKGDRNFSYATHSWSFRFGAKLHSNPDIADVFYLGLRRDRLDFLESGWSLWHNSGFEYRFDMRTQNLAWMRHDIRFDKKWPLAETKTAFKLVVGLIYESQSKYTGVLADRVGSENIQIIVQPNIEF